MLCRIGHVYVVSGQPEPKRNISLGSDVSNLQSYRSCFTNHTILID